MNAVSLGFRTWVQSRLLSCAERRQQHPRKQGDHHGGTPSQTACILPSFHWSAHHCIPRNLVRRECRTGRRSHDDGSALALVGRINLFSELEYRQPATRRQRIWGLRRIGRHRRQGPSPESGE